MNDERFHEIARVLADPTRFAILSRIARTGRIGLRDLTPELSITPATISHHIKELSLSGLIDVAKRVSSPSLGSITSPGPIT